MGEGAVRVAEARAEGRVRAKVGHERALHVGGIPQSHPCERMEESGVEVGEQAIGGGGSGEVARITRTAPQRSEEGKLAWGDIWRVWATKSGLPREGYVQGYTLRAGVKQCSA